MADATLPRAELIERSDGWLTVIDEGDGGWRAIGPFLSEPEAVAAARSAIGETGLIDVRHRGEVRPGDEVEDNDDLADLADVLRERGGDPMDDLDDIL